MSFSLKTTQRQLLGLIASVSGVVSPNSTIPVMSNVVLTSHPDGKVSALGSDMEIEIQKTGFVGEITGKISTTVNCRKIMDVLETIPADAEIELVSKNAEKMQLKGVNGKFSFALLPVDDFPRLENHKDAGLASSVKITQSSLGALISKTAHVTPTSDLRYYLVSSQMVLHENKLRLAATDGHRLAMDYVTIDRTFDEKVEVLLPRKSVRLLEKLLNQSDSEVEFWLFENQARFKFDDVEFVTKLVEGKYPDVARVIPRDNKDVMTVSRSEFLLSVKRASIFIPEKSSGVVLEITNGVDGGNLQISSVNANSESVELSVMCDYKGPDAKLSVNVHYLMDVLSNIRGEVIKLALNARSSGSAAMFMVEGDECFLHVVMPMRM
jgi:DNA polymerase-3 subunit beta